MGTQGPKKVVYAGIASNAAIAVSKYLAGAFTSSSAMLAEAVHSTVDIGNEILLLIGMKRSARPADHLHPFGHGKVLYFYSVLVAVYIFAFGGGLAAFRGVSRLKHPEMPTHVGWNYAVLAMAAVFELVSWIISYRELRKRKGSEDDVLDEVVSSKDPTVFTVFLEDSAGLLGTGVAFAGILLSSVLHNPYPDAIASIVIGLILAAIAVVLARETGALLIGERTHPASIRKVRLTVEADPAVEKVGDLLTMQLSPEEVLLTADVRFRRDLSVPEVEAAIDRIEASVKESEPTIKRIYLEADALERAA